MPNRPTCHVCSLVAAELVAGKYACAAHAVDRARVARAVRGAELSEARRQAEYERLALTQRGVQPVLQPPATVLPLEDRPLCPESFSSERQYAEALAAAMGFRPWASVAQDG